MKRFWRKYHKWAGLIFGFFLLMFCLSGIVLNHRRAFSPFGISRNLLPSGYRYTNWNNGSVKGTLKLQDGSLLLYGNTGVWKTDSCFSSFEEMNLGLDRGVDNRRISNVVMMPSGEIWCSSLYDIYRLKDGIWEKVPLSGNTERISDITVKENTLVVLARSCIYEKDETANVFVRHMLQAPDGYRPSESLFRTVWLLHSGELFGTPGRLAVDAIAIVIIFLCIGGVLHTFFPKIIRSRRNKGQPVSGTVSFFRTNVRWHDLIGKKLIVFTILIAATGMCLRPPLMIPLVMTDVPPVPCSELDSSNPWRDRLRSIRWDDTLGSWLLSTSRGFYSLRDWNQVPVKISAPSVSPMGINVFERNPESPGEWIVGSFSGMYSWNPVSGSVTDFVTGEPAKAGKHGRPLGTIAVSGYSDELEGGPYIFDYGKGAFPAYSADRGPEANGMHNAGDGLHHEPDTSPEHLPAMPVQISSTPMSLWNFALELHVGRCYSPFLGPFSELFVFLSGLVLILILVSGYIIRHRRRMR